MERRGKNYRAALEKVKKENYSLADAAKLVKETSNTKFDATVEVHMDLNLDPKKAEENIRTTVTLPHGTGKKKRVVAFVDDAKAKEAIEAGAIEAGADILIEKVKGGWTDFDIAVAHPEMMKEIAKIGKILGTKGLMPNPKAGTVSADVVQTIKEIGGGRIELRVDPAGVLHAVAGKVSFDAKQIEENIKTIFDAVRAAKPSSVKGTYCESISLSSSMGPGINVELSEM